jgi:hypothetical protein
MLYTINRYLNKTQFIEGYKTLEEFTSDIVKTIKQREPDQFIDIKFGYHNVHITAVGTPFDVWVYDSKHPVYINALANSSELNSLTENKI